MDCNATRTAAAAVVVGIIVKTKNKIDKKRKKRSIWVRPWLNRRDRLGVYNTLVEELRAEDHNEYQRFLRMTPESFDELLRLIGGDIQKQTTVLREPIQAKVKLAATLHFLSSGVNYTDLQYIFRIHKSTLSQFIPEVCEAIYNRLRENYMKVRRICSL